MKRMDFNGFAGNWPFFRLRNNTVEKLAALHSRCGIEGAFHQDAFPQAAGRGGCDSRRTYY